MFIQLNTIIEELNVSSVPKDRLEILQPLIDYIQNKTDRSEIINLNFICTHNSRRSHLSQIWAQTMATFFNVKNVYCYSGGTESTALFPMVTKTLKNQGFMVKTL